MSETIEFYDQAIRDLRLTIAKKELEIESTITQMEHHKEKRKLESIAKQTIKFPTTSTVNPYVTRASLESRLHNRNMGKKSDLKKMKNRLDRLIIKRSQLKTKLQHQGITVPELVSEPVEVPIIILCTNCGCPIDFGVNNCVYCGGVLLESQASTSCPNCQSLIEFKARFCPNCGAILEGVVDTPHTSVKAPTIAKPSPSGGSNTAGIIAVIFGILGLFVFGFIFGTIAIVIGVVGIIADENKSAAIVGLILGFLDVVLLLLLFSL